MRLGRGGLGRTSARVEQDVTSDADPDKFSLRMREILGLRASKSVWMGHPRLQPIGRSYLVWPRADFDIENRRSGLRCHWSISVFATAGCRSSAFAMYGL